MKTKVVLILAFAVTFLSMSPLYARKIKVACIGDSVTFGYGISGKDSLSYPSQLQSLLGDAYEVKNFGHNGATLLRKGHNPYIKTDAYKNALAFEADIAIIHLGLNIYRKLFQIFVKDIREEFGNELPVFTVQLPGMSRIEWPYFREIQSDLAKEIPATYMAVTIDLGDSLDVHPRDKESVGYRLANLALNYTYGIPSEDPSKIRVTDQKFEDGLLTLFFNVKEPLKVKDNRYAQGFELIGPKGLRTKVEAEIHKNAVVIKIPDGFLPEAVWYGFEPFPQTNLLSPAGNPIGPFRLPLVFKN